MNYTRRNWFRALLGLAAAAPAVALAGKVPTVAHCQPLRWWKLEFDRDIRADIVCLLAGDRYGHKYGIAVEIRDWSKTTPRKLAEALAQKLREQPVGMSVTQAEVDDMADLIRQHYRLEGVKS